jgi:dihydroanticapsin dehydrogenase
MPGADEAFDPFGLTDNVALVVGGGGGGMGRSFSIALARAGCDVVVADIDEAAAVGVADEITSLGRKAIAVQVDATVKADQQRAVDTAIREFGRLDVGVNHVGGVAAVQSIFDATEDVFDRTLAVSLKSTLLGAQAQATAMVAHDIRGRIVNTSAGTGGLWPSFPAGLAVYGAAKAGVVNLTKSMAVEFAKFGIRANCVIPGPTANSVQLTLDEGTEEYTKNIHSEVLPLLRRYGHPDETAGVLLFLASNLSSFVTGVAIAVDGGAHLTIHRPQNDTVSSTIEKLGKRPLFDPEPSTWW